MELQPVASSSLAAVGYDPRRRLLVVEFRNRLRYRYDGVPRQVVAALLRAESRGAFFNTRIRGRYPCRRL